MLSVGFDEARSSVSPISETQASFCTVRFKNFNTTDMSIGMDSLCLVPYESLRVSKAS